MIRCKGLAATAILMLATSAGAVEFGLRFGTRAADMWEAITYSGGARVCEASVVAEFPLAEPLRARARVGVFGSATRGKYGAHASPLEDVLGFEGRVSCLAAAPSVRNAVSAYAGLGIGCIWLNYWYSYSYLSTHRTTENSLTATVPVGLRLRLSPRTTAVAEVEAPIVGWYRYVQDSGYGYELTSTGRRFASYAPSFSVAIMLTP